MTTIAQTRPDRVSLGVTLITIAVFMMSIQEALFKLFSSSLSLWQTFTLRGLIAMPLLLLYAHVQPHVQRQHRNLWSQALAKWSLIRSLFMALMFVAMYASIPFLSLSTVAAGIYTAPIFVTLLSAYTIGEPVGTRSWVAIIMGFVGVMVILQPGSDAFTFWTVLPVLGGFLYALSNIATRSKCQNTSVIALSLSLNIGLLVTGLVLSGIMLLWQPDRELATANPFLFNDWSNVSQNEWLIIALLAVLVVAIGMALAGAYQSAPPPIVATFDYSYLIFVALWDYLFFATAPDVKTVCGIGLIITAGLLVTRRR